MKDKRVQLQIENFNTSHLQHRLARMESLNDQMAAELSTLDVLLKAVGFDQGLVSLKAAVAELLLGGQ